jgi:hypothetical protein
MIYQRPVNQKRKPARRLQPGVAGSPLAVIEKSKQQRKVLLHFCFDQQNNETKPESCACSQRVILEQAMEFVTQGWADWLLTEDSRTGKLIRNTKAVVVRRAIVNGEICFPVPRKIDAKELERIERNKREIRAEVRSVLQDCFTQGYVPQSVVTTNDEQLGDLLNSAKEFDEFSKALSASLRKKLLELMTRWWDEVRGYRQYKNKIDEDRFKNWDVDASEAARRVQNQYYLNLAEQLSGDSSRDGQILELYYREIARPITHRVKGANYRPHFWNGRWSYGTGVDPKKFERKPSRLPNTDRKDDT